MSATDERQDVRTYQDRSEPKELLRASLPTSTMQRLRELAAAEAGDPERANVSMTLNNHLRRTLPPTESTE